MFFIVSWLIVTIPHAKRIETAEPPEPFTFQHS